MLERWTSIMLGAIAACTALAISQVDRLPMLDERVIFLVEVGLAVGIGLFVFQYSRHSDRLIDRHVDEVGLLLKRNEKAKQMRRARASRALYSDMRDMADICSKLVETGGKPIDLTAPQWELFKSNVADLHSQVDEQLDRLGRNLEFSDHLDGSTYDKIQDAANSWDAKIHVDEDEKVIDTTQYRVILDMINLVLPKLERHLGRGAGVLSAPFRPAETISQSDRLMIALDRNAYPPGAAIHASLTATEQLPARKVTVTILDMDLKVLARKTAVAPGHSKYFALLGSHFRLRCSGKASGESGSGSGATLVVDIEPKV